MAMLVTGPLFSDVDAKKPKSCNNHDNRKNCVPETPPPIECPPGQFPVGDGCVDCEGPCPEFGYTDTNKVQLQQYQI